MKCGLSEVVGITLMLILAGCSGSSVDTRAPEPVKETPETLYRIGHSLYTGGETDSATVYLKKSLALDSTYLPSLDDLSRIHYYRAMEKSGQNNPGRREDLEEALNYAILLEKYGKTDEATYETVTELSNELGLDEEFLRYARKYAEHHPGDRQAYTLGLANARVGDHEAVIKTQKEAIEKYPLSPYIGAFYRLLGESYFAIDRQQTAERTFSQGVGVVDARILDGRTSDPEFDRAAQFGRLDENRTAMLIGLRKIYRLHDDKKKLQEIDLLLKEKGH